MGAGKVNIKKIAERTGFSPATISNALNYKKGVNPATSAKILQVARELGYGGEAKINRVKFVIYRFNGRIVDDVPYFSSMLDGVERECREFGCDMVTYHLDRGAKDYASQLNSLLADTSSAMIVQGAELADEEARPFLAARGPVVMMGYWDRDMRLNGVGVNNADGARMAVEYFAARGHREIGYLSSSHRFSAFRGRERGIWAALAERGLFLNEEHVVALRPSMEEAYRDMAEYLAGKHTLPTAYFADNDFIALGAMKALQGAGYRVPGDVSLIGFDDLPFCEVVSPRLTSLRPPSYDLGRLAVRRVIEIAGEDRAVARIQACPRFVERDSVKDLREHPEDWMLYRVPG